MTGTKYTCGNCNQEFEPAWSDEEASVDFDKRFPNSDIKEAAIVCDDCYWDIVGDGE